MQGSSKKHDLSPGDSQLPSKKIRIENSFNAADNDRVLDSPLNNSITKNYLSRYSLQANDSTTSLERTYGNFHRRSFSKPIGYIEKQASDRFGPYSMRPPRKELSSPMIIRAKKQTQDDSDPHVTTTAQKIIETLARMSTPVANAQKVSIDTIKPLKPSFTNLRRNIDYGGPPILRSPLVPSSAKIVSSPGLNNSLPMRSLPKLVDSATNTDHIYSSFDNRNHLDTPRYDDSEKHTGGGKIRRTMNRIHPSAPRNPTTNSNAPTTNSLVNHIHEKNDNYNFGVSWSVEDVMDAMISSENTKEEVKNNFESKSKEANSLKPTVNEFKSAEKPKTWRCPGCFVPNKEELQNCVCCNEKKPSTSIGTEPKPFPVAASNSTPTAPVNTAPPLSSLFNTKKWSCPTCMTHNKVDAPECVCCTEKNPNVKPVAATEAATVPTPSSTFKFGAPAATTTSTTSTTSTFTFGAQPTSSQEPKKVEEAKPSSQSAEPAKKWTCPGCWTHNDPTAKTCPCCGENNPNPSHSSATSTAAKTTESSSTPQFSFGFGAPNVTTTANTVSPLSVLKTSTPTVNTTSSPAAVESKPLPATPPKRVLFGAPASKPPESSIKEQQSNVFSGFKFTTAAPSASQQSAPAAAIPTSSLAGDNHVELWRCDICPANNSQNATHCIACGSKKTTGLQKEAAAKKFVFAPFAGGRSPIPTSSISQPMQLPKSSIFGGSKPANEVLPSESPKQKRKHTDDAPDAGFVYTAPEPKLKMKAIVETPVPPPTEIKTGSFLEAFKLPQPSQPQQPSSNVFGTNMGVGGGLVNSSTPTPVSTITTTSAPAPFVFGSQSASTTSAPFQFGAQTQSVNSTFTFGSGNNANKPASSVFGTPAMTSTPAPAPVAQPLITPIQQVQSPQMPSFNLTPNLNFGVPTVPGLGNSSATTPAPLFQFQANAPSDNSGAQAGGPRKIRRAMRRMK